MSSLLQLQAQYESLASQYSQNHAEAAACLARNDEGRSNSFVYSASPPELLYFVCRIFILTRPVSSANLLENLLAVRWN